MGLYHSQPSQNLLGDLYAVISRYFQIMENQELTMDKINLFATNLADWYFNGWIPPKDYYWMVSKINRIRAAIEPNHTPSCRVSDHVKRLQSFRRRYQNHDDSM